jgi:hypothetical protein
MEQKIKDEMVLLSHIKGCFLNDKPATVGWRLLNYPKVATLDGTSAIEFSWEAVRRIMNNDGKFYSI